MWSPKKRDFKDAPQEIGASSLLLQRRYTLSLDRRPCHPSGGGAPVEVDVRAVQAEAAYAAQHQVSQLQVGEAGNCRGGAPR